MKTVYNQIIIRNRKVINSSDINSAYIFQIQNTISAYRNRLSNKSRLKPKILENFIKNVVLNCKSSDLQMLQTFIVNDFKIAITTFIPLHSHNRHALSIIRSFERR